MNIWITCDIEPNDGTTIKFLPDRIAMCGIVITDIEKARRLHQLIGMWLNGEVWRLEDERI